MRASHVSRRDLARDDRAVAERFDGVLLVVRAAPQLDVLRRRTPAPGVRDDVVKFEEAFRVNSVRTEHESCANA